MPPVGGAFPSCKTEGSPVSAESNQLSLRSQKPVPIPVPAPSPPGAPGGLGIVLTVPYQRQEQVNWCWAACGAMLIGYYGKPPVTQCAMASRNFGRQCCAMPLENGCDRGEWPESVYHLYGVTLSVDEHAIGDGEVVGELRAGRPVEVYYAWTGGGAHVAIVVGRLGNGDYLVHDSYYGSGPRTEDAVRTGYGLGAWSRTYRTGAA